MRMLCLWIVMMAVVPAESYSQNTSSVATRGQKPRNTRLSVGAAVNRSVLFLARNTRENNDAYGLNLHLAYGVSRLVRLNVEYSMYRPIEIAPTWYDINAHTIEMNLHFITRFENARAYFYPMIGISHNVFSGLFTGINDFLNLHYIHPAGTRVVTRWNGVNAGVGVEQFFPPFSVFGEARMRVGVSEGNNDLTILDVCYTAGFRYNIRVRKLQRLFSGTRSRYLLDTRDNEW